MSRRNTIILVIILAVVAVIFGPRLLERFAPTEPVTAAPSEIVTAFTGSVAESVQADGRVVAERQVRVPLRINGIVSEIYVEVGNSVEAGDRLLQLETAALERAVENARATLTIQQQNIERLPNIADIEAAQTAVDDAQEALDDLRADFELGTDDRTEDDLTDEEQTQLDTAEQTLSDAEETLDELLQEPGYVIAQAQLSQARIALATAEANLEDATLVAPIGGRVAEVAVNADEQAGGVALTLIDERSLTVDLAVDEIDLANVRVGQVVELTFDAYPSALVRGTVARIAPVATTGADGVTYTTRVTLENGALDDLALRPGMTVNADIVTAEQGNVTLVLNRAITYDRQSNRYTVQRIDAAGNTQAVDVTIGIRDGEFTVIESGVSAGDRLAIGDQSASEAEFGGGGPFGGN